MSGTVTNKSGETVSAWQVGLVLGSGDSVVNIWNANSTPSVTGATVSNVSYNGTLAPGASTTFGFQISGDCSTVTA
jgi:endo-1,4-beta-xylanase